MSATITDPQMGFAGKASRRLLQTSWAQARRSDNNVAAGIEAVAKTVSSDPTASIALLKRIIEPEHLRKFGYRELFWLIRHLKVIATIDIGFVIDVFQAAYAWSEASKDTTQMSSSALLPLSSNRRQDYQGAWHQLEELLPTLMELNLSAASQATARAVEGYVRREHAKPGGEAEPDAPFAVGGTQARLLRDASHIWFHGGFVSPVDAPALMTKFKQGLSRVASGADAKSKFEEVVQAFRGEATASGLWAILFDAAAKNPKELGRVLAPLAALDVFLLNADLVRTVGSYLTACFTVLSNTERSLIENAILALTGTPSEFFKKRLVGCIPQGAIATDAMRQCRAALEQSGGPPPNTPLFSITSGFGELDDATPAEAVDPATVRVRKLVQEVETPQAVINSSNLTFDEIKSRVSKLEQLHRALKRHRKAMPRAEAESAEGVLAARCSDLTTAACDTLRPKEVYLPLRRMLLTCAKSKNPPSDKAVEASFHEDLSWGGNSARISAATGLPLLARCQSSRDAAMFRTIQKLVRDKVAPVRYQVANRLHFVSRWDSEWVWREIRHIVAREATRGAVQGALHALGRVAYADVPRAIAIAKLVLARYGADNQPGMAECRDSAKALIFDIHIYSGSAEAGQFVATEIPHLKTESKFFAQLVARYSDRLLVDDESRVRAIAFYRSVVEEAFRVIDEIARRRDIRQFGSWTVEDQEFVTSTYEVVHEVSLRLFFASGANEDGIAPDATNVRQRKRLYHEGAEIIEKLTGAAIAPVAHQLIQILETFIEFDPPGVFAQIARSVRSSEIGGYGFEVRAAKLIVRIVERYLADFRNIFAIQDRLDDLMNTLDIFVRAGWPDAQALVFRLGEIWR